MANKHSRRRWLVAATMAAASIGPCLADSPTDILGTATLPVPNRTIRLRGDTGTPLVVTAIAVDPLGEFVAAAADDHRIRIVRTSNLTVSRMLRGHRDRIRTLDFDPNGRHLVSAGNDGRLLVWDRSESFRLSQRMSETPALACVRFSPDGREMAAVGFDNNVFLIGRVSRERPVFQCACRDLRAVAYRDDGEMLAVAGRSGDLHLFDPQSGQLLSDHALHRGRIHALAFHRNGGSVICVGEDGTATLFDTVNRRLLQRIRITTGKLFAVAVLNSQLIAVAGSDNVIRIVNIDDGEVVRSLHGHNGTISTLAAGGGLLFSGSYDTTLRRWSIDAITGSGQRIAEGDPSIDR